MVQVSRSWQSLCLDGQLWPLVHLAPFGPHLHPATLSRILHSAQPFITSLSLRGMDNLAGSDLILGLSAESHPGSMRNLTNLDLRGCKRLTSHDIIAIISGAPKLQSANLKGLRSVSSEVMRTLARTARSLRELDVSRCWNISLCDLVVFIKMLHPSPASRFQALRLAGIKGYGTTSGEFLPLLAEQLINLETLDLSGCTHLFDSDFERFAAALNVRGRASRLRHLVISGCSSLTSGSFSHLARRVPDMTNLEAAGLHDMYKDRDADDHSLVDLLRSMPKLQRLDLEGTGTFGGITDRVLDILTPARGVDGVVGRELVELRIGFALDVTPEALIRLVRGCTSLLVLEADVSNRSLAGLMAQNTNANNAVMREFLRRRPATAQLSLIDCRAITPASYSTLAPTTRPRIGQTGYPFVPFGYESEVNGEMESRAVLKTFWSWRRVAVPKGWKEMLSDAEKGKVEVDDHGVSSMARPVEVRRKSSWWNERDEDDKAALAGCIVM